MFFVTPTGKTVNSNMFGYFHIYQSYGDKWWVIGEGQPTAAEDYAMTAVCFEGTKGQCEQYLTQLNKLLGAIDTSEFVEVDPISYDEQNASKINELDMRGGPRLVNNVNDDGLAF